MAEGRSRQAWNHTAAVLAELYALRQLYYVATVGEMLPSQSVEDFHPYHQSSSGPVSDVIRLSKEESTQLLRSLYDAQQ